VRAQICWWHLPRGDGPAGRKGPTLGHHRAAADVLIASTLMSLFPITHRRQAHVGPSRRRGSVWVVVGVALALATCDDATGPLQAEGAPDDFKFSMYRFAGGETTVESRGDTVVLRRTRPEGIDSVRAVPTPDSWRAFWTATERAGVRRWRARYTAEAIVDGNGWSVRIAAGGRLVESSGHNAYPDRFGREHEPFMTDDFRVFLTAVSELVGGGVILTGADGGPRPSGGRWLTSCCTVGREVMECEASYG
jgi:hypothetical protein